MEIVGWLVEYADVHKTSCMFNSQLRDKAYAEEYASKNGGVVTPCVKLTEALEEIRVARGEYEGMALVTPEETSATGSTEETKA